MVRHRAVSWEAGLPCLLYVHARPGRGRWSLATQFFYENLQEFGGTYIEIAAREADGRMVSVSEMLGQALGALGVPGAEFPASDKERADKFHSLSLGHLYLMLIRDAVSAEQVRLLIPSSPSATVVVTTRTNLRELMEYDFAPVSLQELGSDDAYRLMVDRLKGTAGQIDPETLGKVVALCDGHPLLIRIVAAQVNGRPGLARRLVEAAESGDLVEVDESGRLAASFDQIYEALGGAQKRAYRLLALLPGPDFGAPAAAVALQTDARSAAKMLDVLEDANILRKTAQDGRFAFFTMVQSDAKSRIEDFDDRAAVIRRVTEWYLAELVPRDAALANRWRVGSAFEQAARPVSRTQALDWLAAEWQALVACVTAAARNEQHEVAWQLCVGLFKYLHQHGHNEALLRCMTDGLLAAEAAGIKAAAMQLHSHRGTAHLALGDLVAARADFQRSYDCAVSIGHALGEQSALEWLGKVAAREGDSVEAQRLYDASEAVIRRVGVAMPADQSSRAIALLGLQRSRDLLVRPEYATADRWVRVALQYFDPSTSELENRAKCLMVLGVVAANTASTEDPVSIFAEAAELFARDGIQRFEAEARWALGDALVAQGKDADALRAYWRAYELFAVLRADEVGEARRRVESLDPAADFGDADGDPPGTQVDDEGEGEDRSAPPEG
ncbi:hypothetical protein GCM10009745_72370 [Kribbella yunnanensis]|uniref:Tetratricopeptide repeat protein n=2 Tax=Kribbella yunnanensis TaxID=190194 RepID=A0ABP4V047_9ACTN